MIYNIKLFFILLVTIITFFFILLVTIIGTLLANIKLMKMNSTMIFNYLLLVLDIYY